MSRAIDRVEEVLKFVFTGVKGAKAVVCSAKRRANTAVVANFMMVVLAIYNGQVFRILERKRLSNVVVKSIKELG